MIQPPWTSLPDLPAIAGLRLQTEIGRGLHSVVYRASRGNRVFAVKIPRTFGSQSPATIAAQFRREASALAIVHHPGLPAVIEVGQTADLPYIVMEYVEGRTLLSVLESSPLPEDKTLAIAVTLAGALAAVHRQGVTHRDVQPRNILIDERGLVKLIDFGFAAYASLDNDQSSVLGTLRYSAPEQTGVLKRPVDGRSDLYALGAVLFECIAGMPPFVTHQAGELLRMHAVMPAPDLKTLQPAVSPAFAAIVARLLCKDPDDRYQTAEGLLSDLDQISSLNEAIKAGRAVRLAADDRWTEALYEDALVGRDRELALLRQGWNAVRHGQGTLVLVDGPAGMGKSHLGRELLHRARSTGGLVLTYTCSKDALTPFAAIRSAVEQYGRYLESMPQAQRRHAEERICEIIGALAPIARRIFPHLAPILSAAENAPGFTYEQDMFNQMLADLLLWMTRVYPASVWLLDDAQAMDEASFAVVRQLVSRMEHTPLLIIVTLSDTPQSAAFRERLLSTATSPSVLVSLEPLDAASSLRLISAYLGGYAVEERIGREIIARSAGSPLAIREYVQTILDAGMLHLSNGQWLADEASFARLQLPQQVLPLVLARVGDLDSQTRSILQLAAVLGFQFQRAMLSLVWHGDPTEVSVALAIGVRAHLIERSASGMYHFSHQSVHNVFLDGLDAAARRAFHLRIAAKLDDGTATSEHAYRLAHHYALAESGDPAVLRRTYEVSLAAGNIALANYAYDEAYAFLRQAHQLSQQLGLPFDAQTEARFGEVCYRIGSVDEALTHLSTAIERTADPYDRARLRIQYSRVQLWNYKLDPIWKHIELACAELNEPFSTQPLALIKTIARNTGLIMLRRLGVIRPRVYGRERERLIILEHLYDVIGTIAYLSGQRLLLSSLLARSMWASAQIGLSAELVRAHCNFALLAAGTKSARRTERHFQVAANLARKLNDRSVTAHIALYRGLSAQMLGQAREAEHLLRRCLDDQGQHLDAVEFSQGCADLAGNLYLRGYVAEAWQWVQRGLQRLEQSPSRSAETLHLKVWSAPLLMTMGNVALANEHIIHDDSDPRQVLRNAVRTNFLISAQLAMMIERNELGESFEALLRRFVQNPRNRPRRLVYQLRHIYVIQGYARLLQATQSNGERRHLTVRRFARALKQLGQAAATPIMRGHYLVLEGAYKRLGGDLPGALRSLAAAETIGFTHDSPRIGFEVARQRAHILNSQGQPAAARREALRAYDLALEHSWVNSARIIANECGLDESSLSLAQSQSSAIEAPRPDTLKLQRYLDALLKVSLAWATIRDPDHQAQMALDSVIRILGAERAFLFLIEGDSLVFRAGRDANGNDVRNTESYSRTLIERVRASRQPLVVSSTDDGVLTGIESVITQNLRSVLVAPLLLENRLLGVVYLDNRLAWGIFSQGDVEILRAIANHIALALETARTAQLEINIAAEQRQRRLAETLRSVSTVLNSTLDLNEVLDQALTAITQLIPYDSACIALRQGDYFQFVALKGHTDVAGLRHLHIPLSNDVLFQVMDRTRQPIVINDTMLDERFNGYGRNNARSWLGIPLVVHDEVVGFLAIDRNAPNSITERDAEIGMIFAAQAAISIVNARLFGEVQRLAITDSLTEVSNRRHFFELAEREWKRTRRYDHPLSAMMIDVDYFKRVNDTYGHSAGDTVLRAVARICRESLREADFLGRYGGEEFAVMLPDTDLSAAHDTAERLREAIALTPIMTEKGPLNVTVSIGVASLTESTPSVASLIDRADRGLYIAKQTGRDRVVMA